jgi:hypothetical protein
MCAATDLKKLVPRYRQKVFTTNNHYEWSKWPVAPEVPYLQHVANGDTKSSVYIIMEKLIVPQDIVIVVQIVFRNKCLG